MKTQKTMWVLVGVLSLSLLANLSFVVGGLSKITTGKICGEAEIAKVNQIAGAQDLNIEEAKTLKKQIAKKPRHLEDANCVQISYMVNAWLNDVSEIKNDYRRLVELNKKGERPDLKINDLQGLEARDQFIKNIDSQNYGRG